MGDFIRPLDPDNFINSRFKVSLSHPGSIDQSFPLCRSTATNLQKSAIFADSDTYLQKNGELCIFRPSFRRIEVVQETIDPNARIEYMPNTEDDPHKRKPGITRAKELLGWEPKVDLPKGLPLMVSDFRKRIFGDHNETHLLKSFVL